MVAFLVGILGMGEVIPHLPMRKLMEMHLIINLEITFNQIR